MRFNLMTCRLGLVALLGAGLALTGCGEDDDDSDGAGGAGGMSAGGAGGGAGGAGGGVGGAGGGGMGGGGMDFSTTGAIEAHLDGKLLVMSGDNIPSDPNGFNENINFGQATQCYNSTRMAIQGGIITVTSQLGTLNDAPEVGDVGICDRDTVSNELTFDSTGFSISGVSGNGECFDFDVTYAGFAQEGRGSIAADGSEVQLELFFKDQAVGHRCADGAVGAADTVQFMGAPFAGDAVQVYSVEEM